MFKSDKRKKELSRLKKQEEKRQRRFSGQTVTETDTAVTETDTAVTVTEESEKDPE
jgi:lipopolysaccharide assembly outer membrane protein LptD (OstA)